MDIITNLRPRSTLHTLSLYGDYVQERENKHIIESEKGFATYLFVNDGCYIEDIYVAKDFRKTHEAARMADQIAVIAKEKGFSRLYGTVSPKANNSTASLKVLLAYGFSLHATDSNLVYLVKEI